MPARDLRGVAAGFKRKSSDGVMEAAEKKQCLAVDEKDIKPDVD